MKKRIPKVPINTLKDAKKAVETPGSQTPAFEVIDSPVSPNAPGLHKPVGVIRPRGVKESSQVKEEMDQPITPRLVQSRKGSILEIFGSQKNIDIEAQSKPKEGFLSVYQKLTWQKKYFVILDGFLMYFPKEKPDMTKPEGVLHLANCDVVDCGTSKRFSFAINCPNGDGLTLMGDKPNDVWEWMTAIYLASKVSTKTCLTAELSREMMEEHSRKLQILAKHLVHTIDTELKALHSHVRSLKQATQKDLEKLKSETNNSVSALSDAFDTLDFADKPSKAAPAARNPVVDQVVVIAMKALQSQTNTLREEVKTFKKNQTEELRRIKEDYEAQVFELATKVTNVRGQIGMSVRGSMTERGGEPVEGGVDQRASFARAVIELRDIAQILSPILYQGQAAGKKDLDSSLSAAVRTKLVPVIKDLPTVADLVKQLEEERSQQARQRQEYETMILRLKERIEISELDKSSLAAEGQQAYEMLTHIEEQLFTDQTKDGSVFDLQDPTHVKVYKVMNAFSRSMALVTEVESQLFTLTQRSKQTLTTRRYEDED